MSRRTHILAACAAGLLLLPSCVKEDRSPCPCWLEVDLSAMAGRAGRAHLSVTGAGEPLRGTYSLASPDSLIRTLEVGRGLAAAAAVGGLSGCTFDGRTVRCAEGEGYGPVVGQCAEVDCRGEGALFRPLPNKQHARVTLRVLDPGMAGAGLELSGDVCGIDLLTMRPVAGPHRAALAASDDGAYRFNLPRQADTSEAVVGILLPDGRRDVFPMHDYIRRAGYDWGKPSLDDIEIVMDRVDAGVTVTVTDWETGEDYIITL